MADHPAKSQAELIAELKRLRREVSRLEALVAEKSGDAASFGREAPLRELAAQLPMITFALDPSGTITHSDGGGLTSLGLQPSGLVGRPALEAFADIHEIQRYVARALDGESQPQSFEIDGRAFDAWHAQLRDQEGNVTGVAGIILEAPQRNPGKGQLHAGRRFMEQMLRSHERDRQLIAYEIHDGLVQDATGALMQLETLLQGEHLPSEAARRQVQHATDLVRKSVAEARQLIGGLRPPILDELGVVPAIEYLVEEGRHNGLSIEFSSNVQFDRLEPLLETTIYRIVQEGIANAQRHSRSDRVAIRLTQVDDRIHLEIEDWGIGFDPVNVIENRFGLQGIRERARLLRGRAIIDSAPGKGTRISVDLPVAYALHEVTIANSWSIE